MIIQVFVMNFVAVGFHKHHIFRKCPRNVMQRELLTLSSCRSRSRCQRRSALLWMSTRQCIVASRCSCCSSPALSQISSFLCSWSDASISRVSNVCMSEKVLVSVVSVFCSSCGAVDGVCSGCWVSLNVNSPSLMSSWHQNNKIKYYFIRK